MLIRRREFDRAGSLKGEGGRLKMLAYEMAQHGRIIHIEEGTRLHWLGEREEACFLQGDGTMKICRHNQVGHCLDARRS
jgi:hypothetical protein